MESLSSRTKHGGNIELPLAPMADVFIVVLILILKTLTFDGASSSFRSDVMLPEAGGAEAKAATYRVEISKNEVTVNDTRVLALEGYQFEAGEVSESGLSQSLAKSFSKTAEEAPARSLALFADKDAPYAMVRVLLQTAMSAGITDIQIAVSQESK